MKYWEINKCAWLNNWIIALANKTGLVCGLGSAGFRLHCSQGCGCPSGLSRASQVRTSRREATTAEGRQVRLTVACCLLTVAYFLVLSWGNWIFYLRILNALPQLLPVASRGHAKTFNKYAVQIYAWYTIYIVYTVDIFCDLIFLAASIGLSE